MINYELAKKQRPSLRTSKLQTVAMKTMTWTEANTAARKLWVKWVSSRPAVGFDGYLQVDTDPTHYKFYDLDYAHKCILEDYRATLKNPSRITPSLFREVKGELILLGKVRKALDRASPVSTSLAKS